MKRLTRRDSDGEASCVHAGTKSNGECVRELVNRVADDEDLEEKGLLVRLPCKKGDTIWVTSQGNLYGCVCRYEVTGIHITRKSVKVICDCRDDDGCGEVNVFYPEDFGKIVFTNEEEAGEQEKAGWRHD